MTFVALGRALRAAVVAAVAGAGLAFPGALAAHGPVPPEPPSLASLVLGWQLEPVVASGLLAAAAGWLLVVRRIRAAHPDHPVPALRSAAFLGGLGVIAIATMSGIDRYDTTLFSVHMAQHLLLVFVSAPLLALAAPITQLLRAASPAIRRRWLVPVLHSGLVAVLGHPLVAWLTFTLVMWVSHFSPLFDGALENEGVHTAEHLVFIAAAMLFWWPVIAADPARRRLGFPARVLYLLAQMPPSSFLGMAILFASAPLYRHYATLGSPYGIDALADQELAGGVMWLAGDVAFIVAILAVVAAWMRHEARDAPSAERRADAERARIRQRADQLAQTRGDAAARGDGTG
jgi:putative membrane protein